MGPYWQTQWNPVSGCTYESPGCQGCWAREMHNRFHPGVPFAPTLHPEVLSKPLHWRKPRAVFVCNTGDLFHKDVPDEFIAAVFGVMAACPQHTFLVLTKRAERMQEWFGWMTAGRLADGMVKAGVNELRDSLGSSVGAFSMSPHAAAMIGFVWPLPNVWLGVTAEDQQRADERIPLLLATPAAHRWVSAEPLLESIVMRPEWLGPGAVEQVIPGAESGRGMRPCPPVAIPLLVRMCELRGARCFVKQLHINGKLVTDPAQFPPGMPRGLGWRTP